MKANIITRILIILLPGFYAVACAQPPDTLWTRIYGGSGIDEIGEIQEISDGGFIIAGSTNAFGEGLYDVYLIRTDANGDTIWTKTYGGSADDRGRSVRQLPDGGFIITGYTRSFGNGSKDAYLIRADSAGDTVWTRVFGRDFTVDGRSVRQTDDGGFIICGWHYSDIGFRENIYLLKVDSLGNELWSASYGGENNERGWCVEQTSDGGYIVVGWTESYGAGGSDVYLLKTDDQGDTLWTRTYGGELNDEGRYLKIKDDGGFIIAGKNLRSNNRQDFYLISTDSTGDTIWTRSYGTENGMEVAHSMDITSDGGYILGGYYVGADGYYLVRTEINGDTIWTCSNRSSNYRYTRSVLQTSDGGFLLGGFFLDIYLIKFAPDQTAADDDEMTPRSFALRQNRPNPFNTSTTISYELPIDDNIVINIYDLLGRKVATLYDGYHQAGEYSITWNAVNSPPAYISLGWRRQITQRISR